MKKDFSNFKGTILNSCSKKKGDIPDGDYMLIDAERMIKKEDVKDFLLLYPKEFLMGISFSTSK